MGEGSVAGVGLGGGKIRRRKKTKSSERSTGQNRQAHRQSGPDRYARSASMAQPRCDTWHHGARWQKRSHRTSDARFRDGSAAGTARKDRLRSGRPSCLGGSGRKRSSGGNAGTDRQSPSRGIIIRPVADPRGTSSGWSNPHPGSRIQRFEREHPRKPFKLSRLSLPRPLSACRRATSFQLTRRLGQGAPTTASRSSACI